MEKESDFSLLHEMFGKALNDSEDEFAVSMFSTIIRNDSTLIQKAINLILDKIKANNSSQSLRSIELLEECMSKSGPEFQTEISKYRFLNELSKLVSVKYMGKNTCKEIKDKIMDCFLLWTAQYPEKDKIKSVYDCLKNEGIQHSNYSHNVPINCTYQRKTEIVDEENEKKLKKLLQSTNKDDIKKANLLIQHLVKQDEKKRERKIKQKSKLKEIDDTVFLFNQVIDTFMEEHLQNEESSGLLEDLFGSCTKYKYMVSKIPDIMDDSEEELIRDTIRVNDNLLEVIEKYNRIQSTYENSNKKEMNLNNEVKQQSLDDTLSTSIDKIKTKSLLSEENPIDDLVGIFTNLSSECLIPAVVSNEKILEKQFKQEMVVKKGASHSTIDELSADLLDKSFKLQNFRTFAKETPKISLNELLNSKQKVNSDPKCSEKIDILNNEENASITSKKFSKGNIINLSSTRTGSTLFPKIEKFKPEIEVNNSSKKPKYLSDVVINIDDILPSNHEQIIITNCKEGLRVTLDFAINKPFEHTSVVVVSSINQSQLPIDDFKFDAFVNKPCKLRLLQRDGNFLAGVKPFHPPSQCLHQLMLIYNPTEKPLEVTFTFSYKQGEDPDLIKESLVSSVPYLN